VALGVAPELVEEPVEEPVDELVPELTLAAEPITPPCTVPGIVVLPTLAAADLNSSRVLEPSVLQIIQLEQ
jgi:hypothetical protein